MQRKLCVGQPKASHPGFSKSQSAGSVGHESPNQSVYKVVGNDFDRVVY